MSLNEKINLNINEFFCNPNRLNALNKELERYMTMKTLDTREEIKK